MRFLPWIALLVFSPLSDGAWLREAETGDGTIYSTDQTLAFARLQPQSTRATTTFTAPTARGEIHEFRLEPWDFLVPGTGGVFCWEGPAVSAPGLQLKVVVSGGKFFGQVITTSEITYIDPVEENYGRSAYKVYRQSSGRKQEFTCLVEPADSLEASEPRLSRQSADHVLRTFRLAAAATAEYTEFFGSKAAAFEALVTALSRASGIFEREIGVRLQLVPESEELVFTDKETDPYSTNEPGYDLLKQAQATFDGVIGTANYDLGIVLTRGTYGLAYISSVCDAQRKGSSCIGLPEPTGDAFHVNLVTHELAHQFGANHTFNSVSGICSERRHFWAAYEPGTGSTIMSYASLPCEDDSFQSRNDDYFHSKSLQEMQTFLNRLDCGATRPGGNRVPIVSAGRYFTIPLLTAFELTAMASDPDGDEISYCWEQRDLGPAQPLGAADNGSSPLFRSYPPTNSPARVFPAMEYVLQGENPLYEQLPSTNRVMRFFVTARDNHHHGAWSMAETRITATNTGGAFRIISHNAPQRVPRETEIRWEVAGTDSAPIGVKHIRLTMSVDGGRTFPIVLAESTENDGAEVVIMPNVQSESVRVKASAVGNIFFDVNDADLTVGAVELKIVEFSRDGQTLLLQWTSESGQQYVVQERNGAADGLWSTVRTVEASGDKAEITMEIPTAPARYFRVIQE